MSKRNRKRSRNKSKKRQIRTQIKVKNSNMQSNIEKYPLGTPVYCKNFQEKETIGVIVKHSTEHSFELDNGETIYAHTIKGDLTHFNFEAAKTANFTPKIKEKILEAKKNSEIFKATLATE